MEKKIILNVFDKVVEARAASVAIDTGETSVTYGELHELSRNVAGTLQRIGVVKGTIVGLLLKPSIEYVAAILGINLAGGIFMPIDVDGPRERIANQIAGSEPRCILCDETGRSIVEALGETGIPTFDIDAVIKIQNNTSLMPVELDGDDANYLLFTSGSTGTPKGIVGCHKGLSHFVHWEINEFGLSSKTRGIQLAPLTFDVSLRDIFVPLIAGGTLFIPDRNIRRQPVELIKWIGNNKITLLHIVPSIFRLMIDALNGTLELRQYLHSLKHILLAGEAVYQKDIIAWRESMGTSVELVNLYGPSETTLAKLFYRIDYGALNSPEDIIPLGKPINNTMVMILNQLGGVCKEGERGEVYIKTPFRTKGYFRDDKLNAEVFVQNPLHSEYEDIVYRSGDFGKYDANGNVVFIGRTDGQVKIDGNRVEISEIEKVLSTHPDMKQLIVVCSKMNEAALLACYYISAKSVDESVLRAFARDRSPGYMVPQYFVQIDKFPLSANGKIDRSNLPLPNVESGVIADEPSSPEEVQIAKIWKEVLKLNDLGLNASFFKVGGSSLKGIQIISRIYKEFKVLVRLQDLFEHPTVKLLAERINHIRSLDEDVISPVQLMENYVVTPSQRRFWILSQFGDGEGSIAYSIPTAFVIKGPLDINAFRDSVNFVIQRHESLRTTFEEVDGELRQKVLDTTSFNLQIQPVDLTREANPKQVMLGYYYKQRQIEFNLSTGPLFSIDIFKLEAERFVVFYMVHHIIMDLLSMVVVAREMADAYNSFVIGVSPDKQPLRIQYKDYATWLNRQVSSEKFRKHEDYWLRQFSTEVPVLDLGFGRARPAIKTFNGAVHSRSLPANAISKLRQLCGVEDASFFMGAAASVNALIYILTGETDIVLGTAIAGREQPEVEDLIGAFLNTLALRTRIDPSDTFFDLLKKQKQTMLEAYSHQAYPFDLLIEKLKLRRDISRSPLFDILLATQNADLKVKGTEMNGVLIEMIPELEERISKFDMTIDFIEDLDEVVVSFNYNTDIFSEQDIAKFAEYLERMIVALVNAPEKAIADVDLLTAGDRKMLDSFNDTSVEFPREHSVADLFVIQAQKTPAETAIVCGDARVTYSELHQRSDILAAVLQDAFNIEVGDRVGIMLKRDETLPMAMLAVLKCGAAYVPLDPDIPDARIEYMIDNSSIKLVLSTPDVTMNRKLNTELFFDISTNAYTAGRPRKISTYPEVMYVMYTSGSTGRPKGVMVRTISVVNLITWMKGTPGMTKDDVMFSMTSYSFDLSVVEIFLPITIGAKVVLARSSDVLTSKAVIRELSPGNVPSIMQATPSVLQLLADNGQLKGGGLRILSGGERLDEKLKLKVLSEGHDLWNLWGPTETTVWSTAGRTARDRALTIGKPLANTQALILNSRRKLLPPGIAGEIYLGGDGLAKGYINNDALTAERFVRHPLYPDRRIYRTGDRGRWLPDGNIEFLGRIDEQVKVNGHRIEIGEIEYVLLEHEHVHMAAVVCVSSSFGNKLLAYVQFNTAGMRVDLRPYLLTKLPSYMVPAQFIVLDEMPMTTSGKIDRTLLRESKSGELTTREHTPSTKVEIGLINMWRQLLGREDIGMHENFFELGGNSLKAIMVLNMITKEFKTEINLKQLFASPTIASLSREISKELQPEIMEQGADDQYEEVTI